MKRTIALALLSFYTSSGCGTVTNLQKGGGIYGGVYEDMVQCRECVTSAHLQHCNNPVFDWAIWTYTLAIDLPLTFVGDTLSLPKTFENDLIHLDQDPRGRGDGEWEQLWFLDESKQTPTEASRQTTSNVARSD